MSSGLFPGTPRIESSSAKRYICQTRFQLHSLRLRVILLPCFPVILLKFLLCLPLYTSLYIPNFTSSIMEPTASQVRNYYSQKYQEAHLQRALHVHSWIQPIIIADQMFELPTQLSSIVLEIYLMSGLLCWWSRMMTIPIGRSAMTKVKSLQSRPCNLISKKMIWTTGRRSYIQTTCPVIRQYELRGFHCQKKRSHADTFIARTPLPVGVIASPLLKRQKVSHQHIMRVWRCTGAPASQGWWRPECSSSKRQWRSRHFAIPKGYCWGSETVHGGNCIHKDSLPNHFWWKVLNGWQSLESSHWGLGSSAGISRCSGRRTWCVSIAW